MVGTSSTSGSGTTGFVVVAPFWSIFAMNWFETSRSVGASRHATVEHNWCLGAARPATAGRVGPRRRRYLGLVGPALEFANGTTDGRRDVAGDSTARGLVRLTYVGAQHERWRHRQAEDVHPIEIVGLATDQALVEVSMFAHPQQRHGWCTARSIAQIEVPTAYDAAARVPADAVKVRDQRRPSSARERPSSPMSSSCSSNHTVW
jgi:hypothetical protein